MTEQFQEKKGLVSIGEKLPEFTKKAVVHTENGAEITDLSQDYAASKGKWAVLFWWPKDFTFVCPTEIIKFDEKAPLFREKNCEVIGASTDSEYVHLAWREQHPGLKNLTIPMVADTSKSLAEELGILEAEEKVAYRATFIIDPTGTIRWVSVNDMNVGRNVDEVLRVLHALQTDELVPCDWNPGQETLTATLSKEQQN